MKVDNMGYRFLPLDGAHVVYDNATVSCLPAKTLLNQGRTRVKLTFLDKCFVVFTADSV